MSNVRFLTDPVTDEVFYPLGVMAGSHTKMTLLWTNPSPTSAFAAQTVSLDLSGYDQIVIYAKWWYAGTGLIDSATEVGYGGIISAVGNQASEERAQRYYDTSTSAVVFNDAYVNGSASSQHLTPYQIYGIKLNAQNIQGDPSVYSTSETVVGTWIDGSAIYRKCYTGTAGAVTANVLDSSFNASNIEVINAGGNLHQDANNSMQIGGYINANWYSSINLDAYALKLYHPTTLAGDYYAWVEYIKL